MRVGRTPGHDDWFTIPPSMSKKLVFRTPHRGEWGQSMCPAASSRSHNLTTGSSLLPWPRHELSCTSVQHLQYTPSGERPLCVGQRQMPGGQASESKGHGVREVGGTEEQPGEVSSHYCDLIQSNFPEGRLIATLPSLVALSDGKEVISTREQQNKSGSNDLTATTSMAVTTPGVKPLSFHLPHSPIKQVL